MKIGACLVALALHGTASAVALHLGHVPKKPTGKQALEQEVIPKGNFSQKIFHVLGQRFERQKVATPHSRGEQANVDSALDRGQPAIFNFLDDHLSMGPLTEALTTKELKGVSDIMGDISLVLPVLGNGRDSAEFMAEIAKHTLDGFERMPSKLTRRLRKLVDELAPLDALLRAAQRPGGYIYKTEREALETKIADLRKQIDQEMVTINAKWKRSKSGNGGKIVTFFSNITDEPSKNRLRPVDGQDVIGGEHAANLLSGIAYAIGSPRKRFTDAAEQVVNHIEQFKWFLEGLPRGINVNNLKATVWTKSQAGPAGAILRSIFKGLNLPETAGDQKSYGEFFKNFFSVAGPLMGGASDWAIAQMHRWNVISDAFNPGLYDLLSRPGIERFAQKFGYRSAQAMVNDNIDGAFAGQTHLVKDGKAVMGVNSPEKYGWWSAEQLKKQYGDMEEWQEPEKKMGNDALVETWSGQGGEPDGKRVQGLLLPKGTRWLPKGQLQAADHGWARISNNAARFYLKKIRTNDRQKREAALPDTMPPLIEATFGPEQGRTVSTDHIGAPVQYVR